MDTLPNVNIAPESVGARADNNVFSTFNIIPEAKSTQSGVSVSFVPCPDKKWFVMRANYGRVRQASNYLVENGAFTYLPTHFIYKTVNGKKQRMEELLVPNIVFVYDTKEHTDIYVKHTPALPFLNYYYNHFDVQPDGKNPPLTVPEKDMMNFILATSTSSDHVRIIDPNKYHIKGGDKVKVTSGPFTGVQGQVARIAGQQRVVVTIKGLCTVSTAYIPTAFLEVIDTGASGHSNT